MKDNVRNYIKGVAARGPIESMDMFVEGLVSSWLENCGPTETTATHLSIWMNAAGYKKELQFIRDSGILLSDYFPTPRTEKRSKPISPAYLKEHDEDEFFNGMRNLIESRAIESKRPVAYKKKSKKYDEPSFRILDLSRSTPSSGIRWEVTSDSKRYQMISDAMVMNCEFLDRNLPDDPKVNIRISDSEGRLYTIFKKEGQFCCTMDHVTYAIPIERIKGVRNERDARRDVPSTAWDTATVRGVTFEPDGFAKYNVYHTASSTSTRTISPDDSTNPFDVPGVVAVDPTGDVVIDGVVINQPFPDPIVNEEYNDDLNDDEEYDDDEHYNDLDDDVL